MTVGSQPLFRSRLPFWMMKVWSPPTSSPTPMRRCPYYPAPNWRSMASSSQALRSIWRRVRRLEGSPKKLHPNQHSPTTLQWEKSSTATFPKSGRPHRPENQQRGETDMMPLRWTGPLLLLIATALTGCQDTLVYGESTAFNLAIHVNDNPQTPIEVNAGLKRYIGEMAPAVAHKTDKKGKTKASGEAVSSFSGFALTYEKDPTFAIGGTLHIRTQ